MKKHQQGEVTLLLMVSMMAALWMIGGHMGMMGFGADHADHSASAAQHAQATTPQPAETNN